MTNACYKENCNNVCLGIWKVLTTASLKRHSEWHLHVPIMPISSLATITVNMWYQESGDDFNLIAVWQVLAE
jgi:hypothetical protein